MNNLIANRKVGYSTPLYPFLSVFYHLRIDNFPGM